MKEIRRKHFRFPAYDDETGVKLNKSQQRVLFDGQDDLMTDTTDRPLYEPMQEFHFSETSSQQTRRKRRTLNDSAKAVPHKENLEKHKEQLPDYSGHYQPKTTSTGRKKLFGENTTRPRSENVRPARSNNIHQEKTAHTVRERSYFVPKYVPASIIPDPKESQVPENELIDSMKKEKDSYLLFDTEPVPYQEKKVDEPSVKTFNKVEKTSKKKKETEAKKGHSILERSLQGLIEDPGNSIGENGYFK
ncbi:MULTISPECIES: hypothetical protein [unclassified Enterococcus]|uniref:hypothetical protein n=1 Tax=unclassified Enterococcus TaxID=2608891 RepID=UPI0013EE0640|nr:MULTISPECIES: hypothetical protein [unclassified Enterococcus]